MTNIKLLFLVANLVLLRLVLADTISGEPSSSSNADKPELKSGNLDSGSAIALEQVNSLDYAPGGALSAIHEQVEVSPARPTRRRSGKAARPAHATGNVANLLIGFLNQLEKTDFKRLLNDALSPDKPISRRSSQSGNSTSSPQAKSRSGVLSAEADNLLSVTKQIVKLARSQVVGNEFGSPLGSWLAPLAPSMLAAASHTFQDSHGDFTGASLKSDWFWVVVPAVIVVGAGVIVVPLIAAWLVSHMMNQNTFTVSAGKRRRKRDLLSPGVGSLHQSGSSQSIHSDLFKLIDIHRLLDHELEPQLLVNKLARLHSALNSYAPSATLTTIHDAKSRSKSEKF